MISNYIVSSAIATLARSEMKRVSFVFGEIPAFADFESLQTKKNNQENNKMLKPDFCIYLECNPIVTATSVGLISGAIGYQLIDITGAAASAGIIGFVAAGLAGGIFVPPVPEPMVNGHNKYD